MKKICLTLSYSMLLCVVRNTHAVPIPRNTAIEGRDEFIIAERDWGYVVNYMVSMTDTFPPVNTVRLANGSMKAFRDMMKAMRDLRWQGQREWSWTSQYIIRSIAQSPEDDFALMRDSGCRHLDIGLESFSQAVRYHMGKKFSDADLWHTLEMMAKYGISGSLLTFVGYPTETEADHLTNLMGIRQLNDLGYLNGESGVRMRPNFGNLCLLDETLPLYQLLKDEIKDFQGPHDWSYRDNTLQARLRRYEEIHALLSQLLQGQQGV